LLERGYILPVFEYVGKTLSGSEVTGEIAARSQDEVRRILRKRRILVTEARSKPREIHFRITKRVKSTEISRMARQFATMIEAGLPLVQSLEILSDQATSPVLKDALNDVRERVQSGSTLAEALGKHPKIFDELFVNMVEAGEVGGALDTILLRLASYKEKVDALRRKIKGAMYYPAVISVVAAGATFFLVTFIVPVFARLFQGFGAELPLPTKLVLAISSILRSNIILGIGILVGLGIAYRYFSKIPSGRLIIDRFKLKIPIIGNLLRKSIIARFSRTLGTLLNSGVPILDALEITAKTAGNRVIYNAVRQAVTAIAQGDTIAQPLQETGVFPPMVVQMISVGEKTGGLDEMLEKIADFYEDEVDAAVGALTSIIEPVVIVAMGLVIGFILIAMYLPMFDLIGAIQ
jgi:type IV pilus assembly protein PilC